MGELRECSAGLISILDHRQKVPNPESGQRGRRSGQGGERVVELRGSGGRTGPWRRTRVQEEEQEARQWRGRTGPCGSRAVFTVAEPWAGIWVSAGSSQTKVCRAKGPGAVAAWAGRKVTRVRLKK